MDEVASMSLSQLRATITAAGLSHADCLEKSDLQARAREALTAAAVQPTEQVESAAEGMEAEACDADMAEEEPAWDQRMYPILEAAEQGEATIMGHLLDMNGLGVDTPGEDGDTALHIGCLYGKIEVVQECLRRGAVVTALDEDRSTPLHDACAGGFYEIAKLLLDAGAPIFVRDSDGDTPLHLAARGGHGHVAELLMLRAGEATAQEMLATQNELGERPVDLAEDPTLVARLRNLAAADEEDEGSDEEIGPQAKR
jgi:ankyrin repeat protein